MTWAAALRQTVHPRQPSHRKPDGRRIVPIFKHHHEETSASDLGLRRNVTHLEDMRHISFWPMPCSFSRRQRWNIFSRVLFPLVETRQQSELAGQTAGWSNPDRLCRSRRYRCRIYSGHLDQRPTHGFVGHGGSSTHASRPPLRSMN